MSGLHIRMKGVSTEAIKYKAEEDGKTVRELYLELLHGENIEFDLTCGGSKSCFDVRRNFTVATRDKFSRNIKFLDETIQKF